MPSREEIKELWEQHALKREGMKRKVYKDTRGFLTVGIGHLVTPEDNLSYGEEISVERVFEFFDKDSEWAIDAAIEQAEEIGRTTTDFIVALTSVNFQLGPKWHKPTKEGGKGFINTYAHLVNGRYDKAIQGIYSSAWFRQTPVRVEDFAAAIRRLKKPQVLTCPKKPSFWDKLRGKTDYG